MPSTKTTKIIHREGAIIPKVEDIYSNLGVYGQLNWNPMVFSWLTNNISFPYLLQKLNFTALESLYAPRQHVQTPFTITKDQKDDKVSSNETSSTQSVKSDDQIKVKISTTKLKKKAIRVSACKNYIGLLCAGFARTLLTAEEGSEVLSYIKELLNHRKMKYEALQNLGNKELMDSFKDYIYSSMCGKKVKKSNRERDFKTRNTEELDILLIRKEGDDEITCLRKEVLKEMVNYFFNSDCYSQWLSKGMISETNRFFFVNNKEEIQKKFQNPAFYKPRFNHVSNQEF